MGGHTATLMLAAISLAASCVTTPPPREQSFEPGEFARQRDGVRIELHTVIYGDEVLVLRLAWRLVDGPPPLLRPRDCVVLLDGLAYAPDPTARPETAGPSTPGDELVVEGEEWQAAYRLARPLRSGARLACVDLPRDGAPPLTFGFTIP